MTLPILMLLRGALVIAVALVAIRMLRGAPAHLRYVVLASALGAVLVLPALDAIVPAWHTGAFAAAPPTASITPDLPIAEPGVIGVAFDAPQIAVAPAPSPIPWAAIIGALYVLGIAAVLARLLVGAGRARVIARRGTPVERDELADAWDALDGRGAPPRLVVSEQIEAPIVVGAIAPVVVVPRTAVTWTPERWRVVLLHELAHVRQRDGIANLIAQLACAVHWINPLAWIAMRRLREQRELAADDAVLRAGARASSYAEHLLAIATSSTLPAPSAALAMVDTSRFEARVVALLDGDRTRAAAGFRRAFAVVAGTAAVAVGAACVSPDDAPVASTTPTANAPAGPVAPRTNTALEAFADQELERTMTAHHAAGAVAIVLDAKSGKPLVVLGRGGFDPYAARSPGSTIKPFTIAAALEAGTIDASAQVDCESGSRSYGKRTMSDASPHGKLDLGGILAVSSNVCAAKIAEPLGDLLGESLRRYHLAAPAHVDTRSLEGASIASGEGLEVSAFDLATAYTALADDGVYHGGASVRVMREETARTLRALLERVVTDADGTGGAARIANVRVGGKTGTTRSKTGNYYSSFVGIVPADAPRFVVLVGVDGVTEPGGKVAAPVFATIAAKALAR